MRHGKKINHLGRTAAHRKAMLSNMAASLILHKRLSTTVAKAKALRKYVEPLLTKSKNDTTHSRRTVFAYLQEKEAVKELFDEVSAKIANRPGGYTRILKTGLRLGDNAETTTRICWHQLVQQVRRKHVVVLVVLRRKLKVQQKLLKQLKLMQLQKSQKMLNKLIL
jgi:ribosomal protein L17